MERIQLAPSNKRTKFFHLFFLQYKTVFSNESGWTGKDCLRSFEVFCPHRWDDDCRVKNERVYRKAHWKTTVAT